MLAIVIIDSVKPNLNMYPYFFCNDTDMAKVKRVKISESKIPLKSCRVQLKRPSRKTIEQRLKINQTTKLIFNIDGKIKDGKLKIDETTIESNNMVFNVCMKVGADGFSVTSQSSLPQMKTTKQNQKPNLTVALLQPKIITKLIDESWRKCKLNRKLTQYYNL